MKAVILVGGAGTRLRPVTYETPKPLITVKKKPILSHLIEFFHRHGVQEVALLAAEEHADDFSRWEKAWKDDLPLQKISTFLEEKPRGTFGGLVKLKDWIGGEDFILSNGDELKDFDLTKLIGFHKRLGAAGTIALVKVPNPGDYGVPVLEGDYIKEFLEKPKDPPSNYINSGLYVLNPSIFDYAHPDKEFQMIEKDVLPGVAKARKLAGLAFDDARWYDCGTLERWERAMREW